MKTFDTYYNKKLAGFKKVAKENKMSVTEYIEKIYRKSIDEYRKWQKSMYEAKDCHSFWHRECTNKGIECHRCDKFYSFEEWDKMNKKERDNIKNS